MNNLENKKGDSEIDVSEFYEDRFKLKEQTLSTLTKTIISLNDSAPKEFKVVFNIAAFVNVISYDILVICRDILIAESKWQKKHYSRQAVLVIYETINDLFEILGKDFKSLTMKIQNMDFQLDIKEFRSKLNQFKENHFSQLQTIRNASTAHREHDAVKQLTSILTIDEDSILEITFEFEGILHDLEKILQEFFKEIKKDIENGKKI